MDIKKFALRSARNQKADMFGDVSAPGPNYGKHSEEDDPDLDVTRGERLDVLVMLVGMYLREFEQVFGRYAESFLALADDYLCESIGFVGGSLMIDHETGHLERQPGRLAYVSMSFGPRRRHQLRDMSTEVKREVRLFVFAANEIASSEVPDFLATLEVLKREGHPGVAQYLRELRDERSVRSDSPITKTYGPKDVKATVGKFLSYFENVVNDYAARFKSVGDTLRSPTMRSYPVDSPEYVVVKGYDHFLGDQGVVGAGMNDLTDAHLSLFIRSTGALFERSLKAFGGDVTVDDVVRIADEVGDVMKFVEVLKTMKN